MNILYEMASTSRRSHRTSSIKHANVLISFSSDSSSSSSSTSSTKSLPAILSRKRKRQHSENEDMDYPRVFSRSRGTPSSVEGLAGNLKSATLTQENVVPSRVFSTIPVHKRATLMSAKNNGGCSRPSSSSSRVPLGALQPNSAANIPVSNQVCENIPSKSTNMTFLSVNESNQEKRESYASKVKSTELKANNKTTFKPQPRRRMKLRESWYRFREFVHQIQQTKSRSKTPFPSLRWADEQDLWDSICKKETGMYLRLNEDAIMEKHSTLQPRMRSILVDWMIEVSEVYTLHRETLYLAIDFLDRFLGNCTDIPRTRLQLVGVTCLFIAAKIEEIYPPKLHRFAFVTDGACSEEAIMQMELVVLKKLNWGLTPYTPNRWVKTFMQVNTLDKNQSEDLSEKFTTTQYSELDFVRTMQLMDLIIMDIGSLSFRYSVLAASAIYHCHDEKSALESSGYQWEDIASCVEWMAPFAFALRESGCEATIKPMSDVIPEDYHNIQTHCLELAILEDAQHRQQLLREENERNRHSPDLSLQTLPVGIVMTPPDNENDVRAGDETLRDAMNATPTFDPRSTNQQPSIFFSPISENEASGIW